MIECRFVQIKGQGEIAHVKELISYDIRDFSGEVEYNGDFYLDDENLPIEAELFIHSFDSKVKIKKSIEILSRLQINGKENVWFKVLYSAFNPRPRCKCCY